MTHTRTCRNCNALIETEHREDACTICYASPDDHSAMHGVGYAFGLLILAVLIVGVIAAFTWIRP